MADMNDLTRRWCLGWQASRDLPAVEETDDALWIHCSQPGREYEVFALNADEDRESVGRLAAKVLAAEESTWLSVTTADGANVGASLEAAGLKLVLRSETFMRIDLADHPRRELDPAFRLEVVTEGGCVSVLLHDAESGELAAHGHIGLAGTDAIADRILTQPGFRRRGLGGVVMSLLAREALARGARNGLLIASEEGQFLYSTLGWARVADVVIASQ